MKSVGHVGLLALAGLWMGCVGDAAVVPTRDAAIGSPDSSLDGSDAGGDSAPDVADAATFDGAVDGAVVLPDPNANGPFAIAEKDDTLKVAQTGDTCAVHVAYPTAAGPFPVVIVAHGFQIASSQYYGYVKRLATFGYVALTVDFPTSLFGNDNSKQAKDLLASIDWAKNDPTFGTKADVSRVGMSGHSLGGKLALLAATQDPRVKAAFTLDPVDSGGPGGCNAPQCVVVKSLMPSLNIPTGFVGETTDAMGGFQPCAPGADNFATFYAQARTPSLQVTAIGANHMSFVDDAAGCGLTCSFCNKATAPNAQVNAMARALMVAFYERHLKANTGYDAYLTGAVAQARYVTTAQATIVSK
jgi:chlorophyllase